MEEAAPMDILAERQQMLLPSNQGIFRHQKEKRLKEIPNMYCVFCTEDQIWSHSKSVGCVLS